MIKTKATALQLILVLLAGSVVAQPTVETRPLSAIDWLSRSVTDPSFGEPPAASEVTLPSVTVTPLGPASKDGVGLLSGSVTGLPRTLWSQTDETTLVDLIRAERVDTLPALQDLLRILMLARADAPQGADATGALFLARVDKLLDLGAIDQAQALIEASNPDTPQLFRRWFDVALLSGTENEACEAMDGSPSIAPTYPARIFCLARNGDWNTAVLTLNTHRVLGDITPQEEALLSRFLDPELFEGEPPLPAPDRISPLTFRMHEAIGEPLITANLPLAFSHADLRVTAAWKSQLDAAERLARHGSISENTLLRLYTARTPAASGGIWDRAAAMQRFDRAMTSGDAALIADALPAAWDAMQFARTEIPFARLYGSALSRIDLPPQAAELAFVIGLLSPDYEAVANAAPSGVHPDAPFLIGLTKGRIDATPNSTDQRAIASAFRGAEIRSDFAGLLADGKLGEALLRTLVLFQSGLQGDARSLTQGLALLRATGLEDTARRTALQYLLLDRQA